MGNDTFKRIGLAVAAVAIAAAAMAAALPQDISHGGPKVASHWRDFVKERPASWFQDAEAKRIADNILLYQRSCGGWPKNIDMARELTVEEVAAITDEKPMTQDATIDNGATTTELSFLAKMYSANPDERYRKAFQRGVDFLEDMQYPSGGWPQFMDRKGYSTHITYNDDAMVNVLLLLRKIAEGDSLFARITSPAYAAKAKASFDSGVRCILKTQIAADGKPTVWCAQHDEKTLLPAKARAYELPSFSGKESVEIVKLLMSLKNPSDSVKKAVVGAMEWFERAKITGKRLETFTNSDGKKDVRMVDDPGATPLWARFYNLDDMRPFVCDRDGVKRYDISELGFERRNGYGWYGDWAAELYKKYDRWKQKNLK